jgi:hypothetical protein
MSVHEQQFQATAKYHYPEMLKTEQNGGENLSSVVPGSDQHGHEWADVLKELEPFY